MRELSFWLDVRRPERRRIEVTLDVECRALSGAAQGTQEFFLATWTPGSYLIREYSRHLSAVRAADAESGQPLACRKTAKNVVRVDWPPAVQRIRFTYSVYAHELSVRTADVTPEHAYWNHACVLLWPRGQLHLGARVVVQPPLGWELASALPTTRAGSDFVLDADDFARAVDAPVLTGRLQRIAWQVRGVPHEVVLEGLAAVSAPTDLRDRLTRLIECAADVFDGTLPYPSYTFLCLFSDAGHGGLEHMDSTTLLSARTALRRSKDYRDFLSLAVHELFHCWNVKRMRPAEFWAYDYEQENYTAMLWLAEGFTAYYDDLLCRRAEVHSLSDYLGILGKTLTAAWTGAGRLALSLSDSSFDAWIRLYRPDENTRNSSQNYYGNGSIAALVLDLTIRSASGDTRSLDDAMRHLYRTTYGAGRGFVRADVVASLSHAAGCDLGPLLESLVDGPLAPDLAPLLAEFGVKLVDRERDRPYLGITFDAKRLSIASIHDHGPAADSGLAPGDEVLALDGLRVTADNWAEVAECLLAIQKPARMLTASRGVIVERMLTPIANPVGTITLEPDPAASPAAIARRVRWIGQLPQP